MENKLYNLTMPQKSILLTEQYYSNTNINNICGTAIIKEKIDFKILEKAVNFFLESNDSFRLKFIKQDNTIKQYVEKYYYKKIKLVELQSENDLSTLENNLVNNIYNLEETYYEINMFRFPDSSGGFLCNIHHIAADSWTLGLICKKIMHAYNNLINNIENEINIEQSYIKYIETESEYFNSSKYNKDKTFWENKFETLPNIINLPSSKSNTNSAFNCTANRLLFVLPKDYVNRINKFCNSHKISIFNFFMAALSTYIHKVTNSNKFVVGTPILNRTNFNEKNTTGMFINIAPFLIDINKAETFSEIVNKISTESISLLRHQRYPYSEILKYVRNKDTNFPTLFNVLLSYQITIANNETNIEHTTRWTFNGTCADDIDIQIFDLNDTHELNIAYDYKTSKFNKKDIIKLHKQLTSIIEQVLENEDVIIQDLDLLSDKEKEELIYGFNQTEFNYDKTKVISELFEKQVNKTPNRNAISFENQTITYKELDKKANKIANYLRKTHNIKPGDFVTILLNRSIELIICILGVVKSGATYVAIDPEYPNDRINYMINNCDSKLIFTNNVTNEFITDLDIYKINIDTCSFEKESSLSPEILTKPEDLLYVIYTSGSTGKPKGVTINNKNVNNFILGMQQFINFKTVKSMLSIATVCFDMFVFELWGALLNGLTLVLANEDEQKLPHLLNQLCVNKKVDIFQTTPSRFSLLFDNNQTDCFSKVKHILIGGESVPKSLFEKFKEYDNLSVHHMYGPTETTVWSTGKTITDINKITIGKPIINTQIYILDENNSICPIGIPGEIYISGDGVGSGYLNNSTLNTKSFIKNPFIPNSLMYKTGDSGMYNENGEIIYLNRIDNQVKIRGYRIELEEISNNILKYNGIKKCIVIDNENETGKKYLAAYFVAEKEIDIIKLKKHLISLLPNYMIPSYFIKLDELPLTFNHKIDRKSLPKPKIQDLSLEEPILPQNDIEQLLFDLIKDELEITNLGINHDLFNYNIDSLNIINIQVKLLDLNIKINTQDFYKLRTIEKIAKYINNKEKKTAIYNENELITCNNTFFKHSQKVPFISNKYKNILLTGVTGYLGIHILYELLNKTNSKITCILRNKKQSTSVTDRLKELYLFYFNTNIPFERIDLIESDLTKPEIGLSKEKYKELSKNVDLVINAAANVRYYGNYDEFKKINIDLPNNLSDFCMQNNIKFIHISTLGVSGNYLVNSDKNYNTFNEDDFYIGQKYTDNVYIQTKFEAEMLIYNKVSQGLNASIIRVGNLTGRYSDGHFQKNIEENAFYNILRMILKFNIIPNTMLEQFLEFTPVDLCASAIVNIIQNLDYTKYVFHLFNHNYLSTNDLINIFKTLNYDIEILSGTSFKKQIINLSKEYPEENILKGVVNDIDETSGLTFSSTVNQQNSNTNYYLNKLNFKWPKIGKNYITKIIKYMDEEKYI